MDLKKVSLFSLFTGKVKKFSQVSIKITQDYYPEIMGQLMIINGGFLFKGIWKIVSGWLDPVTRNKINIISGSGKKELLKIIDSQNLPKELGGEFEGDVRENPGPWSDEIKNSIKNQTFYHSDKSIYKKYFLTEQERDLQK